ncbi:MAG: UDP-2,3-diacylglucosamine diphosphatase [Gammaproteobacteria bacterium]
MTRRSAIPRLRYRTVFLSDVHLGFRGCSADYLLEFLDSVDCDTLYLVGDIIDLWQLKKRPSWPQAHNEVLRTILGKAKHGTRVVYVPGNHDDPARDYVGLSFGNIRIEREVVHTLANGERLLVLHGDEFDTVVQCSPWAAKCGAVLYAWLIELNHLVNWGRRRLGWPYWSLAAFLKHKVKNAVQYIGNYEAAVVHAARQRGVDGVVCGHIHRAEVAELRGLRYLNCGDWVESCTALAESRDGSIELLHWLEIRAGRAAPLAVAA